MDIGMMSAEEGGPQAGQVYMVSGVSPGMNATPPPGANLSAPDFEPRYPGLVAFSDSYSLVHGYVAAVICFWGGIANIANIVVLTRKNMVSSTNYILMWLAVADLLTMLSYFPVSIHFYVMKDPRLVFPSSLSLHWIQFMLFHINFTVVMHTVAIWLTIILAIFRYLYICYPAHGADLCSISRAKIAILAVYFSTAVICVPNYLCTVAKRAFYPPASSPGGGIHDNLTSSSAAGSPGNVTTMTSRFTYYELDMSSLAEPFLYKFNYWIQAFLIKLIPCALLTILTVLLIIAMTRANRRRVKLMSQGRKDESDRAREHNRTTAMLLAIVALFLLTELPQGILTLCSIFVVDFFGDVYVPLGDILDIAALLNNSINFVLYCSMSRQFRDTFVQVFCGCCPETRPGWLKVKTYSVSSNGHTGDTAV